MDYNSPEFRLLINQSYLLVLILLHLFSFRSPNIRWLTLILILIRLIDTHLFVPFSQFLPYYYGWLTFLFLALANYITLFVIFYRFYISSLLSTFFCWLLSFSPYLQTLIKRWLPIDYPLYISHQEIALIRLYKIATFLQLAIILQYPISYGYDQPDSFYAYFSQINSWLFNEKEYALWDTIDTAYRLLNIAEFIILVNLIIQSLRGLIEVKKNPTSFY